MSTHIKGFDELHRKLDQLARNAEALNGTHSVKFDELFPPNFMRRFTSFVSADEMFEKSGFKIESKADFEAIPDAEWDQFIRTHTRFASWKKMQETAGAEWTKKQLGL